MLAVIARVFIAFECWNKLVSMQLYKSPYRCETTSGILYTCLFFSAEDEWSWSRGSARKIYQIDSWKKVLSLEKRLN